MEPLAIPVRSDAVKWQVVDDEAILVHVDSGYYFSLNSVGLYIWQSATGEVNCREIIDGIMQEFDVDEATAWRDMTTFLEQMLQEELMSLDDSRVAPAS